MAVDKSKALDTALAQIEKQFGKGAVMRLGQNQAMQVEAISTGSFSLDMALGIGGLPRGRIVEVYGPESSGKTTLALHCIAQGQKNGGYAAFIDVEHALDPVYARALGVDVDALAGKPESDDDWREYYKQGYSDGDARVEDPKLLVSRSAFETLPNGMAIPTANPECAALFWRTWNTHLDAAGIDFVKVDSQGTLPVLTRGLESYASLGVRHDAVEYATNWIRHEDDNGDWEYAHLAVIHCMGMTPENYWQRCAEGVARTSDDFFPNIPESLAEHAIENAYCSLLIGCLCYCDWDMFWTRHPHARTHMLLRWISGGPIYCSDKLGETDSAPLAPLFDADGNLTHPDGVGVPVLDSLLADPVHGDVPLGIRNTFRGDEVLLFVGLNADAPQTAHIRATESPLTVFDPQTGERVHLSVGEDLALTLHYGECELRILQTLT